MAMIENRKFRVFVDDNFHYMAKNQQHDVDGFDTYNDAVIHCKKMIDEELLEMYNSGISTDKLYDYYMDFGSDPYIRPNDEIEDYFSAWNYAKEKSVEICR